MPSARYCTQKTGRRRLAWSVLLMLCLASPLPALAKSKPPEPDPAANPAIAALKKSGAKFSYLGRVANIDGWVAEMDGQTRTIYKPANGAYVFIGTLYAPDGGDITAEQLKKWTAGQDKSAEKNSPASEHAAAPGEETRNAALPAGERLMQDLEKKFSVTVGGDPGKPLLIALILPSSGPSQDFWRNMRGPVEKGLLRLRLYPAGLKDGMDEHMAALLLQAKDPMAVWDKFIKDGKPIATEIPAASALEQVRANTDLIDKWRLPAAPYLLYRSKSGIVKVVQGNPADIQALIDDLGREKAAEPQP